jgi:pre-rRNA-processing protein TSR3
LEKKVKITIFHAKQCNPKKCTALKLKKHGFARIVKQLKFLPRRAITLNPFSKIALSPNDRLRLEKFGVNGLDLSWEHAENVLLKTVRGTSRCLPILLAGNPVNFAKPTKLSTVEALAAALYIGGFKIQAEKLLSIFKWGHTFLEINSEKLESYSNANDSKEIIEIQNKYL